VQSRHRILTAQFDDLQLPDNGIPLRRLAQPEQPIGHGKKWDYRAARAPHIRRSGKL
jgi:hypothetical protein